MISQNKWQDCELNLAEYVDNYDKVMSEKFQLYYENLIDTNSKFNLTAITEKEEVYLKHFLDSVLPYKLFPLNAKIIDIGSGAGFPSIPLKIIRPDLTISMVDSLNKRVNFLSEIISKLNLSNITATHARAEDIKEKFFYDFAVARAVASLSTLLELTMPFVRVGGAVVAYKASNCDDEVQSSAHAIKILGGKLEDVKKIPLTGSDIIRSFVIVRKISPTPSLYPRGKNLPKSLPL